MEKSNRSDKTDKSIQIIDTYPTDKLFQAIVGGYGGIAIILEATLVVVPNEPLMRVVEESEIKDYDGVISMLSTVATVNTVATDIVFYNGNIYPKREDTVVNVCYVKTDKPVTNVERIQPQKEYYWGQMLGEQILRRTGIMKYLRAYLEPKKMADDDIMWRNWELTYDTNTLKPLLRFPTTTILQEYFLPLNKVTLFLPFFWFVMHEYQVNILNVSLRYVKAGQVPILNYCSEDRMAVVLYINIGNNRFSIWTAQYWTRLLIDASLSVDGTYYLPYLPFATIRQFRKGYPRWKEYLEVKEEWDPENRLRNLFLSEYAYAF